jgi:eukaryotic-like serine/threonine-protein kinase
MIGRVIHNYRIEASIGAGGMGTLYRASHSLLPELNLAIKVLKTDSKQKDRFKNEAQILAKLNHANIATFYNFILEGNDYFIVMELVEGEDLEKLLFKKNKLPIDLSISIIRQALEGLSHAHKKDILHRDIKPSNIILRPDGVAKLVDFGIAKAVGGQKLTQVNSVVGTLEYLSPELVKGEKEPSQQSDIYAMGVLLFELLSGQLPFQGNTEYDLMQKIINHKPINISELNTVIPTQLESIITKCLSKNPKNRYGSASELLEEINKVKISKQTTVISENKINAYHESIYDKFSFVQRNIFHIKSAVTEKFRTLSISREWIIFGIMTFFAILILCWAYLDNTSKSEIPNKQTENVNSPLKPVLSENDNQLSQSNQDAKVGNPIINHKESINENNPQKNQLVNPKKRQSPPNKNTEFSKPQQSPPVSATNPSITPPTSIEKPTINPQPASEKRIIRINSRTINVRLTNELNWNEVKENQEVNFTVTEPVMVDGITVIQAGATAYGTVRGVKDENFFRKKILEFRINRVKSNNGMFIELRASTFREEAEARGKNINIPSGQIYQVETVTTELLF